MCAIGKCQLDTVEENEEQDNDRTEDDVLFSEESLKKPAYLKHRDHVDLNQARKDIESAQVEWEIVSSTLPPVRPIIHDSQTITCEEVLLYFRSLDMSEFHKRIKPVKPKKGIEKLFNCLFGPPKLHPALIAERDFVFTLAQCPFDSTDNVHIRVLQTIYKKLTASIHDCPRYGSHWEDIGFQGVDPATDLRGVGFLGLYNLLQLLQDHRAPQLWQEISLLSHNEQQEFPFCVMGINITRIVLETLRAEVLNRECNRVNDVISVITNFYNGLCLKFYRIWKTENKSIMDSGFVLKDLAALAKKKPYFILQQLQDYCSGKSDHSAHHSKPDECDFSDIGGIAFVPSS